MNYILYTLSLYNTHAALYPPLAEHEKVLLIFQIYLIDVQKKDQAKNTLNRLLQSTITSCNP